jgi:hypothetical protein
MTQSRIKPATTWLVEECLNQLCHHASFLTDITNLAMTVSFHILPNSLFIDLTNVAFNTTNNHKTTTSK